MQEQPPSTILRIDKKISHSTDLEGPKFKLKRTGEDLPDHEGVEWIYLQCPYCGIYTKFFPVNTIIVKEKNNDEGLIEKTFHSLATCEHCEDIVYLRCWEVDWDPDWHFGYEYHHPRSYFSLNSDGVPPIVFSSFAEAHTCLFASAYLATVVMCRRTIEALVKDKGVNPRLSLGKAIEKLAKDFTLHETMSQVADLVRIIGNFGAHASDKKIKKEDAEEVYKLTEQLIEMIYILPDRIKQTKEKIENAKCQVTSDSDQNSQS